MRVMGLIKRVFLWIMGIIMAFPGSGRAAGKQVENKAPVNPKQEEQYSGAYFSKDELLRSLKQLNNNPQAVRIISAMCYEMAMTPQEVDFQCSACGKKTTHSMKEGQGALVQQLEYIKRSLKQIPYKISVDATGLCSVCNKDKDPGLVMKVSCFNCNKQFSWKVKTPADINMLQWLYLKPPFKEIDGNNLGIWGSTDPPEQKKIKEGATYILEHVFCPECRKQIRLED